MRSVQVSFALLILSRHDGVRRMLRDALRDSDGDVPVPVPVIVFFGFLFFAAIQWMSGTGIFPSRHPLGESIGSASIIKPTDVLEGIGSL